MNKRLGCFLILVFLFNPGCVTHSHHVKYKILDVPLFAQATGKWCWAASGEMIMHYYGKELPQHVQVNNRFDRSDCGPRTRPGDCIKGGWPEFGKYGFDLPGPKYGALSWQELVKQIHAGQPVGFSWEWKKCKTRKSNGSHYMVARGCLIVKDTRLVVVNDPLPVDPDKTKGGTISIMTYDDYVQFCPRYTHSYTHYGITKSGRERLKQKINKKFFGGPGGISAHFSKKPPGRRRQGVATAVLESLELLKALPRPILKQLGFKSRRMLKKISPGNPFKSLAEDVVEIHYPLEVDKKPVTSVTIRKRGENWAFAVINDWSALLAIKARMETPPPREDPSYFMVQIQSMNLTFLAYFSMEDDEEEEEDNRLYLILTNEYPGLTLPLYVLIPAEEVFLELKYLLEQWAEEKGGAALKNQLKGHWEEMEQGLWDLESGEKNEILRGMKRVVEIINNVFVQLENREEG